MGKTHIPIFAISISFILIVFIIYILSNNYIDNLVKIIENNPFIGPVLLIVWRVIGIIVPAVPAGVVSFAVVPVFGWLKTYLYTLTGILIGTSISFWLARRFKEPLVAKFVPLKKLHKLEGELSERKRFAAILAIRLFTVPVMDFSSYAAGLTRISFPKFFLATLLASLPDIAIFYFGEQLFRTVFGKSVIIAVGALFFLGTGYFIIKRFVIDKNK
ncbi:MAG: VTT domain-containing protein [Candidatus Levybacteria bacterium]|nr:VTT domain-containing protein [Candidatus Levybacteria bacterium]